MKIGISLTTDMLMGKNIGKTEKQIVDYYGGTRNFLRYLKDSNVSHVELRNFVKDVPCDILYIVHVLWDMGFTVSIHGRLSNDVSFFEYYEKFIPTLSLIKEHQDYMIFTMHSIVDYKMSMNKNIDSTINCLRRWNNEIADDYPIKFALEINRKKKSNDPSIDFNNLLYIISQLDQPNVGICWDVGHYFWNNKNQNNTKLVPNMDILEKVIHTHIHDLSIDDVTHFPITIDTKLPLEKYISKLRHADYSGVLNIELSFDRIKNNSIQYQLDYTIKAINELIYLIFFNCI